MWVKQECIWPKAYDRNSKIYNWIMECSWPQNDLTLETTVTMGVSQHKNVGARHSEFSPFHQSDLGLDPMILVLELNLDTCGQETNHHTKN